MENSVKCDVLDSMGWWPFTFGRRCYMIEVQSFNGGICCICMVWV